jgi:hypothetical protein
MFREVKLSADCGLLLLRSRMNCLRSAIRLGLIVALLAPSGMAAQSADHPIGARLQVGRQSLRTTSPPDRSASLNFRLQRDIATDQRPMPAWLKWGIIGAGVGAVTFAVLGRIPSEPNPVLQDAAVGAAAGFAVVGGGVALYSWMCGRGSASRRAGMCGR